METLEFRFKLQILLPCVYDSQILMSAGFSLSMSGWP